MLELSTDETLATFNPGCLPHAHIWTGRPVVGWLAATNTRPEKNTTKKGGKKKLNEGKNLVSLRKLFTFKQL